MRPREVDGYARALADGLVRPVPPAPPPLLPGRTADSMFRQFILSLVASGVLWFGLFSGVRRLSSEHAGLRGLLLLAISLGVFVVGYAMLGRAGRRNALELAHGYTTLRLQLGSFSPHFSLKQSPRDRRVPWDYSGIWVLDGHGRVLAAPDPEVDPPGYFPSPNRPGRFELWTGCRWAGEFRSTPP